MKIQTIFQYKICFILSECIQLALHVSVGLLKENSTCNALGDKIDVGHQNKEKCESVCADRGARFFAFSRDESHNCGKQGCLCVCMSINSSVCVVNDDPNYDLYSTSGGVYLKWSSWSQCPLLCPSLNVDRVRRRICATSDCSGDILQKKRCDEQYCAGKCILLYFSSYFVIPFKKMCLNQ